jgi:predicted DNA binding CopG/RHH family protein
MPKLKNKKSVIVAIRLTENQHAEIKEKAAEENITIREYILTNFIEP